MRLDDEFDFPFKLCSKGIKLPIGQHRSKMRNRHFITVHRVEIVRISVIFFDQMAHQLVSKEVVVLPSRRAPALFAAEESSIELSRFLKVVDREGQVERPER